MAWLVTILCLIRFIGLLIHFGSYSWEVMGYLNGYGVHARQPKFAERGHTQVDVWEAESAVTRTPLKAAPYAVQEYSTRHFPVLETPHRCVLDHWIGDHHSLHLFLDWSQPRGPRNPLPEVPFVVMRAILPWTSCVMNQYEHMWGFVTSSRPYLWVKQLYLHGIASRLLVPWRN